MYSDQMKSLTEDIEAAYGARKAAVSALVQETHQSLGNFQREREKMSSELKQSLASNRVRHAKQVQNMRAEHIRDLQETSKELAQSLAAADGERRLEFAALIGEIKATVTVLEKDTTQMLADFRSEHKAMAAALRSELALFPKNLSKAVGEMRAEFAADQRQARGHWNHLAHTMSARRAGN
jgi:phage host-nuclease inhibitor protein Gam